MSVSVSSELARLVFLPKLLTVLPTSTLWKSIQKVTYTLAMTMLSTVTFRYTLVIC